MSARRCAAGLALLLVARGAALHAATLGGAPAVSPPAASAAPAPGAAEDIRDIHGPIALAPADRLWPYLTGAAVAAAIAAGFMLRRRRSRPWASPAERALRALAEVAAMRGGARRFSFSVSDIVRRYVEESFAVRAAHRTTEELLADLMRDTSPVAAQRDLLGEFLRWCDLAKFGGWSLSAAEMTAMLASAEAFVRATSAPAAAVKPAAAAPLHPAERGAS